MTATKARQLGRTGVIVGDGSGSSATPRGEEGTLARIVAVEERQTVLRRTADDDDPYERPIVANADQLVIVTALADPPPRTGMIDRILVAGFDAGIAPLLCLTKADLASPDALIAQYEPLGVPVEATSPERRPGPRCGPGWRGRRSVFVGHSGVGKSTLVNALIPGALTGDRRGQRGDRPRSAHLDRRPSRCGCHRRRLERDRWLGWVIDTPGVRSFGLSHVSRDRIVAAFDDLAAITADCPRGCSHEAAAPECALDVAVATRRLAPRAAGVVPPDARVGPVA